MTRAFTADRRRLTALRLRALGIDSPAAGTPVDAVRHLLAMQAQDYPGAVWSVGLRVPGATLADVEHAQAAGEIVRSWPMRGTLHFVAAEDLGWMLALTHRRIIRSAAARHRELELGESEFDRAAHIARDVLGGGRRLQRKDLLAEFERGGLQTTGQRGPHLLGRLALTGLVALSGQNEFALLDEWVPDPRRLEGDAALQEFALRYFTSHGPATIRDFAAWSSLSLTEARRGTELARERLDELEVGGESYLMAPGLEPAEAAVHVLPGFDEYILGYTDRSAPLAGAALERIVPGRNGVFLPTIVVNGEVVGSWRRSTKKDRVVVTLIAFEGALSASTLRGVARALRRYGEFLGLPVELAPTSGS